MDSKNELIQNGTYKIFLEMKYNLYKSDKDFNDIELYKPTLNEKDIKECFRIYNNMRTRKKKNSDDLIRWCFAINNLNHWKDYMIIFGTLNFSDKALKNTSKKTRRVMVSRYIRNYADNYIANIDYGKENGREHYHFLALTKKKLDITKWKYGGGKFLVVPTNPKDIKKTKNYVLKLNNHTYKESTHLERILKDKNPILDQVIDLLYTEEYRVFKLKFNN